MAEKHHHIRCRQCRAKNRVPAGRLGDKPKCGKCGTLLDLKDFSGIPIEITDAAYVDEIVESALPVVLTCWAPWCSACQALLPTINRLAPQYAGRIKFAKVNVEQNQQTGGRFSIQSIPAMLVLQNGQLINRWVGALPEMELRRNLDAIDGAGA